MKTCRLEGKNCMDCGDPIKVGDKYHYAGGSRIYIYCKECRKKHKRDYIDYKKIMSEIIRKPLFEEEIIKMFKTGKMYVKEIYKNLSIEDYKICRLEYNKKFKRSKSQLSFIIYYIKGDESRVMERIINSYYNKNQLSFEDWKDVMSTIHEQLPKDMLDKYFYENLKKGEDNHV